MQHQDPAGARPHPQHDQHHPSLIAGLAAADLTADDTARARAFVDGCADCRALHLDLLAIVDATRALPPARAPRDFRITAEQAARLRRTGWLARILGPFTGSRSPARPLATTFTTLGLVGVFVATVLPGLAGGAASMGAPEGAGAPAAGAGATAAPAPQLGPAASSADPGEGVGTKDNVDASAAPGFVQPGGGDNRDLGTEGGGRLDATTPANLLLAGSLAFLALGVVLFGLRFAGRRLR